MTNGCTFGLIEGLKTEMVKSIPESNAAINLSVLADITVAKVGNSKYMAVGIETFWILGMDHNAYHDRTRSIQTVISNIHSI